MRARLIGAALAALLIPATMTVSWAGELPTKGRIAAPMTSAAAQEEPARWTGFYAGLGATYGFSRTEFDAVAAGDDHINTENIGATLGLGYDLQMSNIVVGLLADVTVSDFQDIRGQWFVGARLGILLTPKLLAYGLAGYTEEIDGKLAFQAIETTNIKDLAGLTLGGGLEHMLGGGWSAKAEYRYVSYGNEHAPDGVADGLVDGSRIESGEHSVRAVLSKRF